jgi:hypothetical protein
MKSHTIPMVMWIATMIAASSATGSPGRMNWSRNAT